MPTIPNNPMSDLGARGLVVFRQRDQFEYINEETWRTLESYPVQAQTGSLKLMASLNVALARIGQSVFVDLDQLTQLELSAAAAAAQHAQPTRSGPVPPLPQDSIVVKEFDKLYVVPRAACAVADALISGDAGVLVNRDAVIAPIPRNNIAEGTFCVLLNLNVLP